MITKELFIETIEKINKERVKIEKFNKAISSICDGYPIVTAGDGYLNALLEVLKACFEDEGEYIEWWLFENVEKKVWETDGETNETIEYDVSTPEALYDFLMKNKNERAASRNLEKAIHASVEK